MKTMNVTQIAIYLGIKKRTLYDMIADGRFSVEPIPHFLPTRRWNVEDIDAWRKTQK